MQISWGVKITVLYVGFVILILSMVSMAMHQKVDLVSKDYYEQELQYQDKIDKINRTHQLKQQLSWQVNPHTLILQFPKQLKGQHINGTIYFFRPSNETLDKKLKFALTDTTFILNIATNQLKRGIYKMQIDWETNHEKYYNESIIQFN